MIKAGDPQAVAIWEEYNKTAMNAFPQLSDADMTISLPTPIILRHPTSN